MMLAAVAIAAALIAAKAEQKWAANLLETPFAKAHIAAAGHAVLAVVAARHLESVAEHAVESLETVPKIAKQTAQWNIA